MASKNARKSTQSSGKRDKRHENKGRVENLIPFKPRSELGGELDPRINAGGRQKRLGESYKAWLEKVNEQDPEGRTNAELGAVAIGLAMLRGDVQAAREMRSATEGEKLRTWEDDLADLVREGKATIEDVRAEFGNEIFSRIAVRTGVLPSQSRSIQSETTRAD